MWKDSEAFYKTVEEETEFARGLFLHSQLHLENDRPSRQVMICAIEEELGKLTRCVNKLSILPDQDDSELNRWREHWQKEGHHRIVTTSSLLRRFAELFNSLPKK